MMDYEMFRDVFREKLMSHMRVELAGYSLWADRTGKVMERLAAFLLGRPAGGSFDTLEPAEE